MQKGKTIFRVDWLQCIQCGIHISSQSACLDNSYSFSYASKSSSWRTCLSAATIHTCAGVRFTGSSPGPQPESSGGFQSSFKSFLYAPVSTNGNCSKARANSCPSTGVQRRCKRPLYATRHGSVASRSNPETRSNDNEADWFSDDGLYQNHDERKQDVAVGRLFLPCLKLPKTS